MDEWIRVADRLPQNLEEVLTCYYDEWLEDYQIDLLFYYKKGAVIDTKIDRDPTHTDEEKLLNMLFNPDYNIVAPEDGFYISEWDENGDSSYRKHGNVITHWRYLPEPPQDREEEDNAILIKTYDRSVNDWSVMAVAQDIVESVRSAGIELEVEW